MRNKQNIEETIASMSVEEMKKRLAAYMQNDETLMPHLMAVEVRFNPDNMKSRYDVLLIDEEGREETVKFHDRFSRLIYIYTLLHPHGYQRRKVADNNYRTLRQLYNQLYFIDSDALMKTINNTSHDHFISHYVAQSRKAIRQTSPLAVPFAIDRPQAHNGKMVIPFVEQGGNIIIDSTLSNLMSNH